jgi:fructose-1,6-bisphosphatase/inositol monophosphatase family enzyme
MTGAGVKITDWQGRPHSGLGETSAVACRPELHDEVVQILNPGR